MAGSNLSDLTSRDAVADYLAAVTAQLTGPPSARAAVTDELRDGLMEALETHQARGCSPGRRRPRRRSPSSATRAWSPPRSGRSSARCRRVGWQLGLLVTGPLVGLAWIAAVVVNALPPWRHQLIGPWLALPLVGLALAVAGPALGLTVAATGRLGRRLSRVVRPGDPPSDRRSSRGPGRRGR